MHLQQAGVGRIGVVVENLDLALDLLLRLLLVLVLPFDLLSQLELFVQGCVFALDDVHHEDCPAGVLFGVDYLHLAPVVLELGDDVD